MRKVVSVEERKTVLKNATKNKNLKSIISYKGGQLDTWKIITYTLLQWHPASL